MAKSSEAYWAEREEAVRLATIKDEARYNREMARIMTYVRNNITKEVNNFYANYATKEGITYAAAMRRVKATDIRDYQDKAAQYVKEKDFSDLANYEMRIYNLTMRSNRLQLLKANINLELCAGFNDLDTAMEESLTETALKEFEIQAGILGKSVKGNQRYVHSIVNASFYNATFSERLWGENMERLRSQIEHEVAVGLIQGKNPRVLARSFTRAYNVSRSAAETLMRTEMCRVQTDVQMRSIEKNGYDEFMFIAESLTCCPECADLNGQHWKISEGQIGKNLPPIHPNCRCSAAPYMDKAEFERWIIQKSGGQTEKAMPPKVATNRKEAYEIITKDIGFHDASKSLNYIDEETIVAQANQLSKLNSRFHVISEGHAGYVGAENSKNFVAVTKGSFKSATSQNLVYSFDSYAHGKEYVIQKVKESIKTGWSMPCLPENYLVYTTTHEYGHMLENKLMSEMVDMDAFWEKYRKAVGTGSPAGLKRGEKVLRETSNGAAKTIFREIQAIAKENNPDFSLRANISDYGASCYQEAFAEIFANSQLGKPNELGKAMNVWLEGKGF